MSLQVSIAVTVSNALWGLNARAVSVLTIRIMARTLAVQVQLVPPRPLIIMDDAKVSSANMMINAQVLLVSLDSALSHDAAMMRLPPPTVAPSLLARPTPNATVTATVDGAPARRPAPLASSMTTDAMESTVTRTASVLVGIASVKPAA